MVQRFGRLEEGVREPQAEVVFARLDLSSRSHSTETLRTFSASSQSCMSVSSVALAISVSYGASCCSTAMSDGKLRVPTS